MPDYRSCRKPSARPRHESPGMGARSAQVEPTNRTGIAGMAKDWPHREQLIERELAVKHVAPAQPQHLL